MKFSINFEEIKIEVDICILQYHNDKLIRSCMAKLNVLLKNELKWFSDVNFRNLIIFGTTNELGINRQNMSISRIRHVKYIHEICSINFILTNLYWMPFHEIENDSDYMNERHLRLFSIVRKVTYLYTGNL